MPSEQAQKFIDWSRLHLRETNSRSITVIGEHAETPEGRRLIALSYVEPARERLPRALQDPREARRICLTLEGLINLFPLGERFIPPLITLRVVLITLYGFLSEQEPVSDQGDIVSNRSLRISRAFRDAGVPTLATIVTESGILIETPLSVQVGLVERGTHRGVVFSRVEQEIPEPEPEYSGPRPTRFERLNEEENQ
jgi:hypothetical protein